MTSAIDPAGVHTSPSPYEEYAELVRLEMRRLRGYFARQMRWYRATRSVVIVSAALVPVLAASGAVPRWVLGALGAVAAVIESLHGLFQFRTTALNAMKTANSLERVLNRYMTATPPYHEEVRKAFPLFVADIEAVRAAADERFLKMWQEASSSPSSRPVRSDREDR